MRMELCAVVLCVFGLGLLGGCADATYDRISLGMERDAFESAFPRTGSRRTDLGVSHIARDAFGRTDAFVVLQTQDRRAAAKMQATLFERDAVWQRERGYRLRGAVDPRLAGLREVGPIDILRVMADDLTAYQGERRACEAHELVAAGLVRLIQRWPHMGDEGPALPRLSEALVRVPAGGAARMRVDADGVYHFAYEEGTSR